MEIPSSSRGRSLVLISERNQCLSGETLLQLGMTRLRSRCIIPCPCRNSSPFNMPLRFAVRRETSLAISKLPDNNASVSFGERFQVYQPRIHVSSWSIFEYQNNVSRICIMVFTQESNLSEVSFGCLDRYELCTYNVRVTPQIPQTLVDNSFLVSSIVIRSFEHLESD